MRLYLHTFSLRFHFAHKQDFDVFAFIERAAKEGFDGVCISANDESYRHIGGREAWRVPPIRQQLKTYNLACDLDTSGTSPDHLATMLELAQALGADKLRTYTRYQGKLPDIIRQTVADLKVVAPIAAEKRVKLMLENHETFRGEDISLILDEVASPWIAALYDYGNSQVVMEDPQACLETMGRYALSAHLKDHVMLKASDAPEGVLSVHGMPIGEGYLPVIELTNQLLELGCYDIVFENSWGYRAPVKSDYVTEETKQILGTKAFRYAQKPLLNTELLLNPDAFLPEDLVELEDKAHKRSLAWFRRHFSAAD